MLYWQAEAVRLREVNWGPLADQAACQAANNQRHSSLGQRILARANYLGSTNKLQKHLIAWSNSSRWALLFMYLLACIVGITAATATLGSGQSQVNLALALLALLGLHALSFILWLLSYLTRLPAKSNLSQLWLWLSARLARSPDSVVVAQALLTSLNRAKALRPALGALSHSVWLCVYCGVLPSLLILLSTRQYTFHWETTILSPDIFGLIATWLGYVPHLLGFPLPQPADIQASLGLTTGQPDNQLNWSFWLIGCVVVWGLLPRLLAMVLCVWQTRHALARLAIDPSVPGWIELRTRLSPGSQQLGIDSPAPAYDLPTSASADWPQQGKTAAILAHELGPDLAWPPAGLPSFVQDLGRGDSRGERLRIRQLMAQPPDHLLLVCDARITPDRGSLHWFNELRRYGPNLSVLCLEGSPGKRSIWQQQLAAAGLAQADSLQSWLGALHINHE